MRSPSPALRKFLAAYDPEIARLFFAARKAVLTAAPQASELIYDAYNAVTVAYSFSDRLKDAFCHVAAYQNYVNLGFNRGARLADPKRLLVGTGANIRHIRITSVSDPTRPAISSLIRAAVADGRSAQAAAARPQAIVKAVYPKKRRPAAVPRG